jgi:hypothetical protein
VVHLAFTGPVGQIVNYNRIKLTKQI